MSYHESYWVVVATAAPVIALAATVALPEAYRTQDQMRDARRRFANQQEPHPALLAARRKADGLSLLLLGCVYSQVFVLGYSLVSLAIRRDLFTPLVAISGPLGGILLIALVVTSENAVHRKLKELGTSPDDG